MTIRIITFHTSDNRWEMAPHPLGGHKAPWSELIPFFVHSARISDPEVRVELITDLKTTLHTDLFDDVWRFEISQERLMMDRLRYQLEIVRRFETDECIAFLDTDVLLLQSLDRIYDESFDVGITIRDNPIHHFEFTMPYNNGVMFVRANSRTASYLQLLLDTLASLPPDNWAWSGNQFVVRDLVGMHAVGAIVEVAGAKIRVFPCSQYNYSPEHEDEDCRRKFILHFRGDAKRLMSVYAKRLVGGRVG